ncbi:MAG: hypothetical protein V4459_06475 [Pseudomonadota bacterium]
MTRFGRFWIALAALIMMPLLAQSAGANTVGWNEKIDYVRDLPNEGPFEHDGQYFDLGYLWSASGSANTGYVLYHDDRYVVLDPEKMALVREYLGEDPAAGYAPPAGAAPPGARRVSKDDYGGWARMNKAAPAASRGDMPPVAAPALLAGGGSILSFLFIGFGLAAVRHQLKRRSRRMLDEAGMSGDPTRTGVPGESFEARVAARLAALQASGDAPDPPPPPAPAFGRKIA